MGKWLQSGNRCDEETVSAKSASNLISGDASRPGHGKHSAKNKANLLFADVFRLLPAENVSKKKLQTCIC
ncbi:MAG: hypothetical protein PUB14_01705 [Lachnospiraceae bacterium]|nr:hypothetical protein [Lachnospiraceae bacterium]